MFYHPLTHPLTDPPTTANVLPLYTRVAGSYLADLGYLWPHAARLRRGLRRALLQEPHLPRC
jgi:hypothetical protein